MQLVSQFQATKMQNSPSKQYLSKLSKKEPRPDFFVEQLGKLLIDIDHPEWLAMLNKRSEKNGEKPQQKSVKKISKKDIKNIQKPIKKVEEPQQKKEKPVEKKIKKSKDMIDLENLERKYRIAILKEPILKTEKLHYIVEQEKLKIEKEAGNLIEYEFAEFLFFGYLEKANTEFCRLMKKIQPIIINLCNENKPKAIIKRFNREIESIIIDIKARQAEDAKNWKKEKK